MPKLVRKYLRVSFAVLSIFYILAIAFWTIISFTDDNAYNGLHPFSQNSDYNVMAVPVRVRVPVYAEPGGKQVDFLTRRVNIQLPEPDHRWVKAQEHIVPNRSANWLRLDDLSLSPQEILNYYRQGKGTPDPAYTALNEAQIIHDFNHDGQLEIWRSWRQTIPTSTGNRLQDMLIENRGFLLYGIIDGQIQPYFAVSCWNYKLFPFPLPDGTYAFANEPMIWQRQAYRWQHGQYHLTRLPLPHARRNIFHSLLIKMVNPIATSIGIIPTILLALICWPTIFRPSSTSHELRKVFALALAIAVFIVIFDTFCFAQGFRTNLGYSIAATMLLGITAYGLLAITLMKLWERRKTPIPSSV